MSSSSKEMPNNALHGNVNSLALVAVPFASYNSVRPAFSREQQAMDFIAMHRCFLVGVLAIVAGGGQASAAALSAADQAKLREAHAGALR